MSISDDKTYDGLVFTSEIELNEMEYKKRKKRYKSKYKKVFKKQQNYFFWKRMFDIVSSFLMIVILSPILVVISLIIKLSSKGPIIFKDKRIGRFAKEIHVLKFRTMFVDAETNIDKYLTPEQKERWIKERKLDNDPRITPIGRFLRKTSLDELPQLFNVFTGSMSVVGPRPIVPRESKYFTKEEIEIIYSARPGITGYWQVYGRSDVTFESGKRQELELEYFQRRNFWFDIGLIFRTIPAVLKRKGAK